jgi:hypothetical protein
MGKRSRLQQSARAGIVAAALTSEFQRGNAERSELYST